ncbi:metal ABC transporter substrate-binding protein [Octadecabacter sp. 1_MG-2023]|uniref:metal ABC transporter substrate-binding protein n=1 Tax=unclassified Octadecabacter TaxID=196158 RepID=UPI001C0862D6|nr:MULTISPECIES: metal ABC transporter substrate-binding protein [unclassified Octadecabacter]MBU2993960.1 metal ABC transporter substrate-binding protein [Octadecabacter sp. B2R22]MDO6735194.1 metal ABC transporter substrate-binding protein [Octadecabacter sp. 1_MG-2023]
MLTRILLGVAALVLIAFLVVSQGFFSTTVTSSSTENETAEFKVVTTFTVIADMARNVAGDAATVESITRAGAEIHGYQPTPQDLVRASGADLILWNGLNLELWFEQFIDNVGNTPSATISDGIAPLSISSGSYEGLPNPHAWMGLDNALIYIDNIEAAMSEHDPENAETYAANAAAYKEELTAAIGPLRDQIMAIPEEERWLVTCEGAFSYIARDFGLKEAYLWPMNADQTGTPQQVRNVIDTVIANDIPAVFCESTVNTDPAEQVARETGAAYGGVLYVDSLSLEGGPVPTYLDLLRVTTQTIADGLTQ